MPTLEPEDFPTQFALDDAAWDAFQQRLDQPPQRNDNLRRLLTTPAPWEEKPENN